jgi:hypothetical protein
MFELVSALLAMVLLVGIAFPQLLTLLQKDPDKKVGSSYWCVYDGTPVTDLHDKKIAAPKPGRKSHVVAGSHMYAGRR